MRAGASILIWWSKSSRLLKRDAALGPEIKVTEKERMHLVEQIGECMDSAEAEKPKQAADILIDVKARGNRIVLRDYIEINIFLSGAASGVPAPGEAADAGGKANNDGCV